MNLVLEVTGPPGAESASPARRIFDERGGTIGRLPDNHLVLPDPYVSNRHARIQYVDGAFCIEDTSTNGVFLNSMDNRLVRGERYPIASGDQVFIDPYELRVSVSAEVQAAAVAPYPDPFAAPPAADYAGILEPFAAQGDNVDPLRLLGFDAPPAAAPPPRAAEVPWGSVLNDPYAPPAAVPPPASGAPAALIPDDYDPAADVAAPAPAKAPSPTPPSRRPVPRPAAAQAAAAARAERRATPAPRGGDQSLSVMLAAAGLGTAPVTPELATSFGQILRIVVAGVMDVLQARQRVKDEFRMRVTTFRRSDNNPLKFSANADDALHNLLVKRNAAYLGPVAAFEDAFEDVRHHEIAMLTGIRVAFEAMLTEFDPDRLQQQFDKQLKKGALLAAPAKLRYWDLYRDKLKDIATDADGSFRRLFGDVFARAYEEQLERLKADGRGEPR